MSSPVPLRCLFLKSAAPSRCLRRNFHLSKQLYQRPDFPNIPAKASKDAPRKPVPRRTATANDFKAYSEEDKKKLTTHFKYTPAQLAAIEAGEAAIDPKDLAQQATIRNDPMAFEYYDDFATVHPLIDKPVRAPEENHDPKLR